MWEYQITVEKPLKKSDVENSMEGGPTVNISVVVERLMGDGRSVNSEEMAWDLFITSDMISNIVHHTNQKIDCIITNVLLFLHRNHSS